MSEPKNKGGRPPHEPTPATRKRVYSLSACGRPQNEIAHIIGIGETTLQAHYATELKNGMIEANALVAGKLFEKCRDGNLTALIFWMKTRCGWKETGVQEHTFPNGIPPTDSKFEIVGLKPGDPIPPAFQIEPAADAAENPDS